MCDWIVNRAQSALLMCEGMSSQSYPRMTGPPLADSSICEFGEDGFSHVRREEVLHVLQRCQCGHARSGPLDVRAVQHSFCGPLVYLLMFRKLSCCISQCHRPKYHVIGHCHSVRAHHRHDGVLRVNALLDGAPTQFSQCTCLYSVASSRGTHDGVSRFV